MKLVHGQPVYGEIIDDETRCRHYHGESDVIAVKFKCCGRWYPCAECHLAVADHAAEIWPVSEFSERAVLCGSCGETLTISQYLTCDNSCPVCGAGFNPGCANHYHLYFE